MDADLDPDRRASALRWGRRVLVVALLASGACLAFRGGLPEACRDVVAGTSTVRVCEPMAATDPRALLYLLVVLLLLLPELSEVELAGVLTLRRRIGEARTEVAEVRSELAQIRTQAAATASASLHAGLRNQVHVSITGRPEEVGRAVSYTSAGTGDSPPESLGAYAQLAFEAGLAGLVPLMPPWAAEALLLGYTVGEDDSLVPTYVAGAPSPALDAVAATITPTSPRVVVSALDECWAAIAPARDDDGGAVGAVAVLVPRLARASPAAMEPRTEEPGTEEPGTDERLGRELAVWAETVAGVYARLLIDVLSEQTRPHLLAN